VTLPNKAQQLMIYRLPLSTRDSKALLDASRGGRLIAFGSLEKSSTAHLIFAVQEALSLGERDTFALF
jgi:hypothetical protein